METIERYYYQLSDLLVNVKYDGSDIDEIIKPVSPYDLKAGDLPFNWGDMIAVYVNDGKVSANEDIIYGDNELSKLLRYYIAPKAWYLDVCISDTDDIAKLGTDRDQLLLVSDAIKSFVNRVGVWLVGTYPKYKKLIDLYDQEKDSLLASLKTTTSGRTRYNDMPQSAIAAGDLDGDDHLTTLTKDDNESEVQPSTAMARLAEIEQAYKNLYNDWADDFIRTFVIM